MQRALICGCILAFGAAGCGHPATRDECDQILQKTAELKLKEDKVTDPAAIDEAIRGYRETREEKIMKECVGRTITSKAIDCIKRAETSAAAETCLY